MVTSKFGKYSESAQYEYSRIATVATSIHRLYESTSINEYSS